VVEELVARVTEKVTVLPTATVPLTGWVAMATVENNCRRWLLISKTSTPIPGTSAAERTSFTDPKPDPIPRAVVVEPPVVKYTCRAAATKVANVDAP
jgi:hypothetical protein